MSKWPMVKLGDIFQPAPKILAGEIEAPILSITMHNGLVEQNGRFKKRIASTNTSTYRIVKRGQLVVGFPIDEGVLDFQEKYDSALVSPAYGVWNLVNNDVLPDFMGRYLRSPHAMATYKSRLQGTTARRRSLPTKVFQDIEVPLPPLGEQKRIAEILDKINSSIESTTNELYILNNLARFSVIKNCGNPNTFFGQIELKKIATIVTGNTPPRKEKGYYGNHIEWIKSDNLGGTFPSPASESLSQEGMKKGRIADPGSLLMTCIAGSIKSIGKISIVNRKVAFNQQINSIKPHNSDDLHFLYLLFQIAPELVQRRSTGGLKGIVKKSSLESCKIPWPDKQTRKKMGTFCKEWIDLQTLLYKKLTLLRELQRSLSARAFTGEL